MTVGEVSENCTGNKMKRCYLGTEFLRETVLARNNFNCASSIVNTRLKYLFMPGEKWITIPFSSNNN